MRLIFENEGPWFWWVCWTRTHAIQGICASCHRLCDSEEDAPSLRNQRCPDHRGIEPPVQFRWRSQIRPNIANRVFFTTRSSEPDVPETHLLLARTAAAQRYRTNDFKACERTASTNWLTSGSSEARGPATFRTTMPCSLRKEWSWVADSLMSAEDTS